MVKIKCWEELWFKEEEMGLIKKGLSMAVVFIMIIAVFTACTDTSSQTDTINKQDLMM